MNTTMPETILKHPCTACGHSPDWHRFDDDLLVEMDTAGVPWTERPFRCLGPDLSGCGSHCPDFVGQPISIIEPET